MLRVQSNWDRNLVLLSELRTRQLSPENEARYIGLGEYLYRTLIQLSDDARWQFGRGANAADPSDSLYLNSADGPPPTGDVPARMAGICIQEVHRLVVGQELPSVLSARKAYASSGRATTALIEIRKHADEAKRLPTSYALEVQILAIHGHVDRVLGPKKVN